MLLQSVDRLSRAAAVFSLDTLLGQALNSADNRYELPELERAAGRLLELGVLRRTPEQLIRSDRTDRWTDQFARLVSDPTKTNPRVSLRSHLDTAADRGHPLDQAQRYNIVDVEAAGGIERTLQWISSRAVEDEIIHIHGDHGPDIARFPIGTNQLMQAADFVGRTSKALHRKDTKRSAVGAHTVLVVSGDALRSAHRAMLLAAAAEQSGVGKVVILAHDDAPHQFVLNEAVRRGAVSTFRPNFRFPDPKHPRDLSSDLAGAAEHILEVENETLEQAAARAALNDLATGSLTPEPMLAHTLARHDNLNKAAQALFTTDSTHRRGFKMTVLRQIAPHLVDTSTGAGLREGDFLRVNRVPPGRDHKIGDMFRVTNVKPVERTALVKNTHDRYEEISFDALRDMHVRLAAYDNQDITIHEGDRLELERGSEHSAGRALLVSPNSFAFQPNEGPMVSFAVGASQALFLRLGYAATSAPLDASRPAYAVAGSADQEGDQCFTPGAASIVTRAQKAGRVREVRIFTDDKASLLSRSNAVDLDAADVLERAYMDAVRTGSRRLAAPAS